MDSGMTQGEIILRQQNIISDMADLCRDLIVSLELYRSAEAEEERLKELEDKTWKP